ncbi:MAG: thioredoxin family protein [Bacillota bacterium]|nr:thioredoxin family protein [Bacillota bacterium]
MIIQALGGCCKKSQTNYENEFKAAAAAGLFTTVEHVTDMEQIMNLGVLATPGIAIDGKVMASGRVSTVAQILEMIEKRRPTAAAAKQPCCEDGTCECKDGTCECEDGKCECECDAANPEKQKDCCHDQSETCCGR